MKLKVALVASGPEFHDAGSPLLLVVVCMTASMLIHSTVVPTAMVMLGGEKANPLILIMTGLDGVGDGVGVGGLGVAVGVGGLGVAVGLGRDVGVAVGLGGRIVGVAVAVGRGVFVAVDGAVTVTVASGVSVAVACAVRPVVALVAPPQAASSVTSASSKLMHQGSGLHQAHAVVFTLIPSTSAVASPESVGSEEITFACYTTMQDTHAA